MTRNEIEATPAVLILGGSETSARLSSAACYHLSRNPATMRKLIAEIREKFEREEEITMTIVNGLSYELAVLKEAVRMLPPVMLGSPRLVDSEHALFTRPAEL